MENTYSQTLGTLEPGVLSALEAAWDEVKTLLTSDNDDLSTVLASIEAYGASR